MAAGALLLGAANAYTRVGTRLAGAADAEWTVGAIVDASDLPVEPEEHRLVTGERLPVDEVNVIQGAPLDPWGRPFVRVPAMRFADELASDRPLFPDSVVVVSLGRDGVPSEDDVQPWRWRRSGATAGGLAPVFLQGRYVLAVVLCGLLAFPLVVGLRWGRSGWTTRLGAVASGALGLWLAYRVSDGRHLVHILVPAGLFVLALRARAGDDMALNARPFDRATAFVEGLIAAGCLTLGAAIGAVVLFLRPPPPPDLTSLTLDARARRAAAIARSDAEDAAKRTSVHDAYREALLGAPKLGPVEVLRRADALGPDRPDGAAKQAILAKLFERPDWKRLLAGGAAELEILIVSLDAVLRAEPWLNAVPAELLDPVRTALDDAEESGRLTPEQIGSLRCCLGHLWQQWPRHGDQAQEDLGRALAARGLAASRHPIHDAWSVLAALGPVYPDLRRPRADEPQTQHFNERYPTGVGDLRGLSEIARGVPPAEWDRVERLLGRRPTLVLARLLVRAGNQGDRTVGTEAEAFLEEALRQNVHLGASAVRALQVVAARSRLEAAFAEDKGPVVRDPRALKSIDQAESLLNRVLQGGALADQDVLSAIELRVQCRRARGQPSLAESAEARRRVYGELASWYRACERSPWVGAESQELRARRKALAVPWASALLANPGVSVGLVDGALEALEPADYECSPDAAAVRALRSWRNGGDIGDRWFAGLAPDDPRVASDVVVEVGARIACGKADNNRAAELVRAALAVGPRSRAPFLRELLDRIADGTLEPVRGR